MEFGVAESGIPLVAWKGLEGGERCLYLLGGVHGDEPEGRDLMIDLLDCWLKNDLGVPVVIIPEFNPDGLIKKTRVNARGVDLNRNMPTKRWGAPLTPSPGETDMTRYFAGVEPGSEPETRAFIRLLEKYLPCAIVSAHSWRSQVNYDGPGREVAEILARFNRYPVTTDIGYPTPGSLGEYAGRERQIPTVTLELPEKIDRKDAWEIHRSAFEELLNWTKKTVLK